MKLTYITLLLCFCSQAQQIAVIDSTLQQGISFATISFGNGLGTFAGEDGVFDFSKKKYTDVDTLYISAIGFSQKSVATNNLPSKIYLKPEASQLNEVIIAAPKRAKYKIKKRKPTTHINHHTSWLPTVESEVAVLLNRYEGKTTQVEKLLLPINAENQYISKGKGSYATVFKIQFYENKNGFPSTPVYHEKIVFNIDDREDKIFELDVTKYGVFIPKDGVFAAVQVLGYANDDGRLIQSKKYREIETRRGIRKISTSFRPLLPFTDRLPNQKTFVRRVFLNRKKWQVFDKTYNVNSKLIQYNHRNYGLGATYRVYEDN